MKGPMSQWQGSSIRHRRDLEFPFDREHQTGAVSWKSKGRPGTPQPEKQDAAHRVPSKMH